MTAKRYKKDPNSKCFKNTYLLEVPMVPKGGCGWGCSISIWGSEVSFPILNLTNPESLNSIDEGLLLILEYNCVSEKG